MRFAISGATGLVGSVLVEMLRSKGHRVQRLVRSRTKEHANDDELWNPASGEINAAALEGVDAVINLSGENLGSRWSADRKKEFRASRLSSTTLLARTIAGLARKPSVFISGSAIGIYGSTRGDELLDETSQPGSDFLATLCKDWEAATAPAADAGIRVVLSRSGIVLNPAGGVLEKLLLPFKMGAGGKVGSGEQYVSWIARDDITAALLFVAEQGHMTGPINMTAPNPVTNEELAKSLGRVLHRPSIATVPANVVRLMLGSEMAGETVLASQRVMPKRLLAAGFEFQFPLLDDALNHELHRAPVAAGA